MKGFQNIVAELHGCWRKNSGIGLEYLRLHPLVDGFEAESVLINDRFGLCGATYTVRVDFAWRVRRVEIRVVGSEPFVLMSDGQGNWRNVKDNPLPEFDGCIDIDISATPFTNTLPIRRLNLKVGERREITTLYIPLPDSTPSPVKQAYSCLRLGALYKYEGLFRNFTAELQVDEYGLVMDYPSLFERIATS